MENLIINKNNKSSDPMAPYVEFYAQTGICLIEGDSYMDNAFEFYSKLCQWFDEYFQQADKIVLKLKYTYINTSSSRAILEMLQQLHTYQLSGKDVRIIWLYPDPDLDEILLEGEDMQEASGMKFEFETYKG